MSNYKRATLDEDEVSEAPAEATASPDSLEVSHVTNLFARLRANDANIRLSVCMCVWCNKTHTEGSLGLIFLLFSGP